MRINQCPICGRNFSFFEKQAVADGRECSECGSFLFVRGLNRLLARLVMLIGCLLYFWGYGLVWGGVGLILSFGVIQFSKLISK